MTTLTVGPHSTYATIADAESAAVAGDTLLLEKGYSNEVAVLTVQNLMIDGAASSEHIDLQLGAGIGNVTLLGKAPIDVSDNLGDNVITGNDGRNTISVSGGVDVVHGAGGVDHLLVDYRNSTATVTATVTNVTDHGINSVTFDGVENFTIWTGSGNDSITTADGDNLIHSGSGDDTITTGQGHSRIAAGKGNDTVTTGDGGDNVNGGAGNNIITTGAGRDFIHTGIGNDTIITGGGADTVLVTGGVDTVDTGTQQDRVIVDYSNMHTNVTGSLSGGSLAVGYSGVVSDVAGDSVTFQNSENFTVTTGTGDDTVTTGDGADILSGGAGADRLSSAGGVDQLFGGDGNDTLTGGHGADQLTGGLGADSFVFTSIADSAPGATDLITDLQSGDLIDLSQIDANANQAGDQAFVMVSNFTGAAGQATLHYDAGSGQTLLSMDVNGDGVADAQIAMTGDHSGFSGLVL